MKNDEELGGPGDPGPNLTQSLGSFCTLLLRQSIADLSLLYNDGLAASANKQETCKPGGERDINALIRASLDNVGQDEVDVGGRGRRRPRSHRGTSPAT